MSNKYNNLNKKNIKIKRRLIRKKKKQRRIVLIGITMIAIVFSLMGIFKLANNHNSKTNLESKANSDSKIDSENIAEKKPENEKQEVLLSIIGDLTLGTDEKFGYENSLPQAFDSNNKDSSYFMKNVSSIFKSDDYTLGNLETTFTDLKIKAPKSGRVFFNFKGSKDYVNILKDSSIEGVTISNNHIYDYGNEGMKDTANVLQEKGIDVCGEDYKILKDVKGIKFGFLGYMGWNISDKLKDKIVNDIKDLRNEGAEVIIPYFHWGSESEYEAGKSQMDLARFTIDSGADAVIGSHPHVIQTMENYKGKLIAYSMGNFCFGGNFNPSDKRTIILQIKCNLENKKLNDMEYKVIPTMISSREDKNDYVPTIATNRKSEILKLLNDLSPTLNNKIKDEFFKLNAQ